MPVQYLNEEEAKAQTDAGHIYWRPYRGDGGDAPGMWDPDARAGLDPGEVAGHSLRAGLATSAAAAGVPERVIAEQTGHKGTAMLRRYIREGSLFRENAAGAVGL